MATPILADRSFAIFGALHSVAARLIGQGAAASLPEKMLQHAGDTEACGTFTPADGGPTAIVVGARAPVQSLRRLAARHQLEVDALVLFARRA